MTKQYVRGAEQQLPSSATYISLVFQQGGECQVPIRLRCLYVNCSSYVIWSDKPMCARTTGLYHMTLYSTQYKRAPPSRPPILRP